MKLFSIFLLAFSVLIRCNPKPVVQPPPTFIVHDNQYDSEFPQKPVSPYFDELANAIKLISSMTFYKAYQFAYEDSLTEKDLINAEVFKQSKAEYIYQRPSSGTATLISQIRNELLFLTCNHIVHHPDTILIYYSKKNRPREKSPYIHTVSIKIKETLNIVGIPSGQQPLLLAFNKKNDLALVGVKLHRMPKTALPTLNLPYGQASELHWGTFIYLLAYPQGKLMLSHSLVSQPNRDASHNFLFNSTLTRGISGGIVLAIRDGVPNFEIVGIASALGAQTQYYLKPDLNRASWMFDTNQPYKGDIYVDQQIGNNSGIVFAVSVENILDFFAKSRNQILKAGFTYPAFFNPPPR